MRVAAFRGRAEGCGAGRQPCVAQVDFIPRQLLAVAQIETDLVGVLVALEARLDGQEPQAIDGGARRRLDTHRVGQRQSHHLVTATNADDGGAGSPGEGDGLVETL